MASYIGASEGSGPWQVFAAVSGLCDGDVLLRNLSDCTAFDAVGHAYNGSGAAAWEYD